MIKLWPVHNYYSVLINLKFVMTTATEQLVASSDKHNGGGSCFICRGKRDRENQTIKIYPCLDKQMHDKLLTEHLQYLHAPVELEELKQQSNSGNGYAWLHNNYYVL